VKFPPAYHVVQVRRIRIKLVKSHQVIPRIPLIPQINDDEDVAETCGLNINWWKILCFTITSVMIAITGWFAAHYYGTFAGKTDVV
jgi:ABC-type xylose transport system permease subunit